MRLKRTTVLSGNFAKKASGCGAPLSARDRAASESVVQQKIQRKYSLVIGGLADSVQEQEENSGDEAENNAANSTKNVTQLKKTYLASSSNRQQAAESSGNDLAVNSLAKTNNASGINQAQSVK